MGRITAEGVVCHRAIIRAQTEKQAPNSAVTVAPTPVGTTRARWLRVISQRRLFDCGRCSHRPTGSDKRQPVNAGQNGEGCDQADFVGDRADYECEDELQECSEKVKG